MDINKPINSDQFVRLLTPNQKRILAFILSYVPRYSDAEDILQNTLSILWRKYQDYKPGTDFLAWSLTVARYEIMRYLRDCKTKGKLHFDERLYQIIETESSGCLDAFDDRLDALRKCVKKLPTDDTRLLKMRYEQELTFVKIGQRLGLSSVAAFKMIGKIHDRLVRCIRLHAAVREEA
jgi:RNA polymerase sigma-70 factor (ECF subfamily)